MSVFLVLSAWASGPPTPRAPVPAAAVNCAHHVRFTRPYPWHYQSPPATLDEATVLVVEGAEGHLRPREVGQRILFVDGNPVEILARDGARAVVLVPARLDSGDVRVWFGDEGLPERVDATALHQARVAAAGLPLRPVARWGVDWEVSGRNDLLRLLVDWTMRCEAPATRSP